MDSQFYLDKVLEAYIKASKIKINYVSLLAMNFAVPLSFNQGEVFLIYTTTSEAYPVSKIEKKYSKHYKDGYLSIRLPANERTRSLFGSVPAKELDARFNYVDLTFVLESYGNGWLLME